MLCPIQLNRSAQFPVHAVQSLLFEEATNRVNHVALTPFRVKVSLCLNISKMLKVKSEAFSTKQLASINFVLISSGKTKFSMASCLTTSITRDVEIERLRYVEFEVDLTNTASVVVRNVQMAFYSRLY